ncbi:MAG: hypothetical protein WCJ55_17685 [Chloroflexales bacterium]
MDIFSRSRRWLLPALGLVFSALAFSLLFTTPVYADDCTRDPLNAADCMRTPGFRPVISIIISMGGAVAAILVSIPSASAAGAGLPGSAPQTPPAPPVPQGPPVIPASQSPPPPLDYAQKVKDAILAGSQSSGFELIKNLVGPAATIAGSLSDFFSFPDSPKVLDAIRAAGRAWHNNPTAVTGRQYVDSVRQIRDLKISRLASGLGKLSSVVDVFDAVGTGLKKVDERGYVGIDQVLTVGAELNKQALKWILTKNPVIGLLDAAVGGATEMIRGKEGKVDIGTIIDKGADAWDKTTQDYASYTQGGSAADGEIQVQDQFLHGLRRIKDQVQRGEIPRDQGSALMRQLRQRMGV